MVAPPPEHLAFDRPESWALAHFTSATLLTGLGTPGSLRPGSVSVGFELGWLPTLDATQRRVGFNGTEEQDLNKAPFMPRPRVTIGLPASFTLIVAGTPPIPMFGLEAALLAVGLERPIVETPHWVLGARGYGQVGWVRGAYTCPPSVLAFPPGSPGNDEGCQAPSSDTSKLRYLGGEAVVGYRSERLPRLAPHAAVGISVMDVGFQVNAHTFDFIDRTSYTSRGTVVSFSAGVSYQVTSRLALATDAFYSPMWVRRPGLPRENDGLFNVRALVTCRLW